MIQNRQEKTLAQQYVNIFAAVSSYWICSIGLVFINKHLLSSPDIELDAPLFITWYQCLVSLILCFTADLLSQTFPRLITFPRMAVDLKLCKAVLPLSLVFVAMITFNNLCLKYVGVSFYYVGRSLTTVFNVNFLKN
uniref:Uncharacterized protein n=1 Tax=Meloidogyne enterolobii TaxID=390850 RepID=A0A6V7TLJ3_MELEN|nr:unnamed protein product [Meloidogyne enterolobii]